MLEFKTVGALIGPCCQAWPIEVGMLSVPPMLKLWHELQEIKPDLDNLGSKNNFLPSSTTAGFSGVNALIGLIGSLANTLVEMAIVPIDNSATTSLRIIIDSFPLKYGCNGAADSPDEIP